MGFLSLICLILHVKLRFGGEKHHRLGPIEKEKLKDFTKISSCREVTTALPIKHRDNFIKIYHTSNLASRKQTNFIITNFPAIP